MSTSPKVLILGAGLGGLTLAQALRKKKVDFEIFDREDANTEPSGWAVALHSMLEDLFDSMPDDMPPFSQVNHLNPLKLAPEIAFYTTDSPVKIGRRDDGSGQFVRANRTRLRDWLATKIPIQYNKHAVGVENKGDFVVVNFKDGSSATGDMVIGAEGAHSITRQHLLNGADILKPHETAVITGELRLHGREMAEQLELGHSSYILDIKSEGTTYHLFVGLDKVSPDSKSGDFYYHLMWHDIGADRSDHWAREGTAEQLRDFAMKILKDAPPHFRRVVEMTPPEGISLPAIRFYTLEIDELPTGRITLLGDAAHCMTPFRGEGACHAMKDALNLARVLEKLRADNFNHVQALLREYQIEMLKRGGEAARLSDMQFDQDMDQNSRVVMGKSLELIPKEHISI
ncbi:hypothetical protein BKA67DRAFT_644260 [Truncatella angustata]|uniref:FAD-binding domain-containing protein n=1 Tax=Truncatella angustata TaxID=152316 RepID=A0A9P8UU62_9PEZI|nr:uncharacterized protein BKA67DRAFT_644260 [Truncatella angustata]KAH6658424.1 hypothetical protein BKA67DRAFT_644260 [Truncatella angustata]KAH8201602.1 hypothetical protein TruAng_004208 [Truncatella angustata]